MMTALVWVLFVWGFLWASAIHLFDDDKMLGGFKWWIASIAGGVLPAVLVTMMVNR